MVDKIRRSMALRTIEELVGLALACGASEVGGLFTRAERSLAKRSVPSTKALARATRARIRNGEDPLGEALCEIRSPVKRRPLGAYYTRRTIVESMVEWALEQQPRRLIDPGCGSGRFSVAALSRDPALSLIAVDLDPVATVLTRAALSSIGATDARVINADYLTVELGVINGRTAFIANPPYVRHHDLSLKTKELAADLAASLGYTISGLAGLHALFYLVTLAKHGHRGDVGTFVTSAEWLDVGYGSIVRSIFANGLGGRSVTFYDPRGLPFDDAMTTAAITTFCIGASPVGARFRRVAGGRVIRLETRGLLIAHNKLGQENRWSPLFNGREDLGIESTIGRLFRVSRGQVTGCNDYFVMSRSEARERGLEAFCTPLITSAEEVSQSNGVVRDDSTRKVGLEISKDCVLSNHPDLAAYVTAGEAARVHHGYIASRRRPWYSVSYTRPPIVATYMARQAPWFARNPDRLGSLNVIHGLYPRQALQDEALDAVVAQLNRTRKKFVGRGRTYHGGLEKFEPREMEGLPLGLSL